MPKKKAPHAKTCGRCHAPFTARRSDAEFCRACSWKQWSERHPRVSGKVEKPVVVDPSPAGAAHACHCGCGRMTTRPRWYSSSCKWRWHRDRCPRCGFVRQRSGRRRPGATSPKGDQQGSAPPQ